MQLAEMNWPAVAALSKNTPVVIPVAALEQHGHHMPVFTDSILVGEIARRTEEKLPDSALFTPVMWLGNSQHHLDFAGTMSASPRVYIDLLVDMLDNFVTHGFHRIVFLNGHGGNNVPGQQAIFEARQKYRDRHDLLFLFACYWALGSEPQKNDASLEQSTVGHACEYETSMMLALRPNLVGDYAKAETVEPGNPFDPVFRAWTTKDRSSVGHIGHPNVSSAAKGEKLLKLYTTDVVALIEKVAKWNGSRWS